MFRFEALLPGFQEFEVKGLKILYYMGQYYFKFNNNNVSSEQLRMMRCLGFRLCVRAFTSLGLGGFKVVTDDIVVLGDLSQTPTLNLNPETRI